MESAGLKLGIQLHDLVFCCCWWCFFFFFCVFIRAPLGLPWWLRGIASAHNAGDSSLIPGSGDQMEKEMATHSSTIAWKIPWATIHGVAKSWTQLHFHFHFSQLIYHVLCFKRTSK